MKRKSLTRFLAVLLCILLAVSCMPLTVFADETPQEITVTEGDVIADFAPEGSAFTSTDPGVAWVDDNGVLNALKPGTVTVSDGETDYTVTVTDYDDGSPVMGQLKILVRYNDSMQFYDGHVYLLFTSYQDGVTITVPDLYAGYDISDQYYEDIREDISIGSNHTGSYTDAYFTPHNYMDSVTLNRGEIVTIGMYRGFDLSVPQAALGSITNSSAWGEIVKTGKAAIVMNILQFLEVGQLSDYDAVSQLKAVFEEIGVDYNTALDGVVDGGVCFNRELYNQKLEWDQYENVTYETDITLNQLNTLQQYLEGNYGKFSILKNSCATVALKAWNAAVGTRGGEPGAYYRSSEGEGIFSVIDVPKGVRDSIVSRLPGYYLNNSEGVEEPDAGYQDDTGWVYVSAPEKVTPVEYVYGDGTITVDDHRTNITSLMNIAKDGSDIYYAKDEQRADVKVNTSVQGDVTAINSIDFTLNGQTVSVNGDNVPADGIWFKTPVAYPDNDEVFYATDADGKVLPVEYDFDGDDTFCVCFRVDSLPATVKIVGSSDGTRNILVTEIVGSEADYNTEIYVKDGDQKKYLDEVSEVECGARVYVSSAVNEGEADYVLTDMRINDCSFLSGDNYDSEEHAYYFEMPEQYSKLTVIYEFVTVSVKGETFLQLKVGDTLNLDDHLECTVGLDDLYFDDYVWMPLIDLYGAVECNGKELKAVKEGLAVVWGCPANNENIGINFFIYVYDDLSDMVKITTGGNTAFDDILIEYEYDGTTNYIPVSGWYVEKGSVLNVSPFNDDSRALLFVMANGKVLQPGETVTAEEDIRIDAALAEAEIKNMPEEIKLVSEDASYQLEPKLQYKGIMQFLPVYDGTLTFRSSDALVSVDEDGLVTVNGEIPEDGKIVYITACAPSGNMNVTATSKVILGDPKGSRIVGNLTISARRIYQGELVSHAALTFTTYEDVDLDISYYNYNKPNDKYNDLMIDYEQNPEKYNSDPALCSQNELGLEDRESYFDVTHNGAMSEPETVSLLAGESISLSNYGFDRSNLTTLRKALQGSISISPATAALINELIKFENGEEIDGALAFDTLLSTIMTMYAYTDLFGYNPADGVSLGGMDINREIYNQFRRDDSQMPNNYYTVDITADELDALKTYLADPENNYYTLFNKNCASGVIAMWNSTLSDRPELSVSGNFSGVAADPQSLYFELGMMALKTDLDGHGGIDFYPRTVRYSDAVKDVIAKINDLKNEGDDWYDRVAEAIMAYDALSDAEKERVWNYGEFEEIRDLYEEIEKSFEKLAYDLYKEDAAASLDSVIQEDDSAAAKMIVTLAQGAVNALPYNEQMTLDENKAEVDKVVDAALDALEGQRNIDHPILGDVDMDGEVTVVDAAFAQRIAAWMPVPVNCYLGKSDVDGDGWTTITDVTAIQYYLSGLDTPYSIGERT